LHPYKSGRLPHKGFCLLLQAVRAGSFFLFTRQKFLKEALMSVGGIGSSPFPVSDNKSDPATWFLSYMKKPPLERMQEDWLRSHSITKEKWDKMSDEERKAVLDKMAAEIKEKVREDAAKKNGRVDILA
jgi:hypothetical protein